MKFALAILALFASAAQATELRGADQQQVRPCGAKYHRIRHNANTSLSQHIRSTFELFVNLLL